MTTLLPYVGEPIAIRLSLNSPENLVKYEGIRTTASEATLRQGTALSQPVYAVWKPQLRSAGVSWQDVVSVSSQHYLAWRAWRDGERSWRGALEDFVELLNRRAGSSFVLADQQAHASVTP